LTWPEKRISASDENGQDAPPEKRVEELEVRLIHAAILKNDRNISKAAEDLGLSRPTLYSLLKKYAITV
jgi:two-component system NtrC family response regulator